MADKKKTVKLEPRQGYSTVESSVKSYPTIEKGGTDVPAKDVEKIMEQFAKEGYPLRKLED